MQSPADCQFCKIISGDDAAVREIYRDENAVAFFPREPATLGHTLLVPRSHIRDVWDLDEGTAAMLGRLTTRMASVIRRAIDPKGMNIIQSNGEVATQTVMHLHIHLVPRWTPSDLGPIWPEETDFSESAKDDVWRKLRRSFMAVADE